MPGRGGAFGEEVREAEEEGPRERERERKDTHTHTHTERDRERERARLVRGRRRAARGEWCVRMSKISSCLERRKSYFLGFERGSFPPSSSAWVDLVS